MKDDSTPALDRTLAGNALLIAAFGAVSGGARVAQDAAIAWRHGTGPLVDAWSFAVALAAWPAAVAAAVLTVLAAPAQAAVHDAGAARFRAELLGAVLLAAAALLPLAAWALPAVAAGPLGGLSPAAAAHAAAGVPALALAAPLALVGALLSAWLVAAGRRTLTLIEALPPLLLTALLLALAPSAAALFWGTTAGLALQLVAMAALLHRARALPLPRLGRSTAAWHAWGHGALVLLAAQTLFALLPLVDPLFAARLGEGAVATLGFANRLVLGLLGLLGLALQRAVLPLLAQLSHGTPQAARRMAWRWAAAAFVAGVLVAVPLAAAAEPLVALLFERGHFGASDTAQVAHLLRWGLLQLPVFLAGSVLIAALAAARHTGVLALIAALGFGTKLAASAVLAPALGNVGLLLATVLMYCCNTLLAAWALARRR